MPNESKTFTTQIDAPQRLVVLGATGTIGVNTLDVVARYPESFRVFALTGQRQLDKLAQQCRQFCPEYAVVMDADSAQVLREKLADISPVPQVLYGEQALIDVASHESVDTVMAAIVGSAGLKPALAAARAGKRLLLANKESLVMGGAFLMSAVRAGGATLLPIDSEHNAIFQCLPADGSRQGVERLVLTASGGPFRGWSAAQLRTVTPEQACAHPNWVMGRKISVDSATLLNKGLEVIEAHWLFDMPPEAIEVVVHPQSVIHSMVRYCDGSILAQLGSPDMRTPIAHALAWPQRISAGVEPLDLMRCADLTFGRPDVETFRGLQLAFDALKAGGSAPVVLNAANEVAVAAFLDGRLSFMAIAETVDAALQRFAGQRCEQIDAVFQLDEEVRQFCRQNAV